MQISLGEFLLSPPPLPSFHHFALAHYSRGSNAKTPFARLEFRSPRTGTLARQATVKEKCLVQKDNTMSRAGLEPRLLVPESSALTMRLLHLQITSLSIISKQVPNFSVGKVISLVPSEMPSKMYMLKYSE